MSTTPRLRNMRRPRLEGSGRVRRDPRAERLYCGEPAGETLSARGLPRRDPRAWYAAGSQANGRVRIDRSQRPGSASVAASAPLRAAEPALKTVVIAEPAFWVLAVPDLDDGRLSAHDRDVFGGARLLAADGGAVVAVCFGPAEGLDLAGADRVLQFDAAVFAGYAPEARAAAVAAVIATLDPRHVLLPDTPIGGGDLGRRLAAQLGETAAVRVQKLSAGEAIARGNGGRSDYHMAPLRLLLLAPEAADPLGGVRHEALALPVPELDTPTRLLDRGLLAIDPNSVPLAEADFICSAGNGVHDWSAFHAVAAALGATEGGSRMVCDAGLLPRHRQVGASGTLVDPRCYLAFGIAGAPQHLQGITRCERVIAVNTDLHAEMVKRADLAIVQDAQRVMPALTRLIEEKRHGA